MKNSFYLTMLFLAALLLISCTQAAEDQDSQPSTSEQQPAAEIVQSEAPVDPSATPIPATATLIPPSATPEPSATPPPVVEADSSGEEELFTEETPTPRPVPEIPPNAYIETFDGEPDSPQPWQPDGWDLVVHSRDIETWYELEAMEAHHGPNCEGPDITHTVTRYEDTIFNCRNHMMTSLFTSGYGVIYFAPNQLIDLSDRAVISLDVSTYRHSNRDWWDIWITPYDDYVQAPLEHFFPDLMGPPRRSIHIRMPDNPNTFFAEQYDDFQVVSSEGEDEWISYEYVFTPDKARRDTFIFEYDNGRIRFGMPEYDLWWVDKELAVPLDWDKAVVQIGHHSYNPEKSCEYDGTCGPNTWHWDNLVIAPAVPFTIIPSTDRYAEKDSETMTFRQPAPAEAEIRFMGIGADLEASFDGGDSWVTAEAVPIMVEDIPDELFRFYRIPIPEGVQEAQFRGKDKWDGVIPWHVRNATIWSLETPPMVASSPVDTLVSPAWQDILDDSICEA